MGHPGDLGFRLALERDGLKIGVVPLALWVALLVLPAPVMLRDLLGPLFATLTRQTLEADEKILAFSPCCLGRDVLPGEGDLDVVIGIPVRALTTTQLDADEVVELSGIGVELAQNAFSQR